MHKCFNCGNVFEGKFCPSCGAKWEEEKSCPSCGAKLNGSARFCNECGYSFVATNEIKVEGNKKQEKEQKDIVANVYGILKYIPAILFGLFAVLLFIFYTAPVAVLPAQEFMGEKIPSESYGNVYSMYSGILSEIPELKSAMLTLILLAVFTLLYAVVNIVVNFLPATKNKKVTLFGKAQTVGGILIFISLVFYLVFFIVGCVVCGKISAIDEGMELLAAGSCPILLIVFSLIFALLCIGAFVARFLLNKKNPLFAQKEIEKMQAQVEAEMKRREHFFATHSAPVAPVATSDKKLSKRQACIYKHDKRRYDRAKEGPAPSAVIWLDLNKVWLTFSALVLVIVITIICIVVPIANNKFKISKVGKIELGYTQEQVRKVLGDPYTTSTDFKWVYYDNDYTKIHDKLMENSKQQEQAMTSGNENKLFSLLEEETKLKGQLENMTYKYIEISFSSIQNDNEKEYSVISVLLDTSHCDAKSYDSSKEVKSLSVLSAELIYYSTSCFVRYSVEYTDGSYFLGSTISTLAEGETTTDLSKSFAQIQWRDVFSCELTYTAELKASENGWYIYNNELIVVSDNFTVDGLNEIEKSEITKLTFSDNVTTISENAFKDLNSLTNVTISDKITKISESAFSGCDNIKKVKLPSSAIKYIPQNSLKEVIITKGSIPDYAFEDCKSLEKINIDGGVSKIGKSSFANCSSLTSVIISEGVNTIENYAFDACTSLTSITVPKSITTIGSGVFSECSNLESIVLPFVGGSIKTSTDTYQYPFGYIFGTYSYDGGNSTRQYYYGSSTSSTTYTTYYIPSTLKNVTITGGNILYGSFYNCNGLTSITITDNVTSIGSDALYGCDALQYNEYGNAYYFGSISNPYLLLVKAQSTDITSCTINAQTRTINANAFANCTGLTSISIPDGVMSIGDYAFKGCSGLTSITVSSLNSFYQSKYNCLIETSSKILILGCNTSIIPTDGSVTTIKSYAFEGCTGLTSISVPDSVTKIGSGAFAGCSNLESIVLPFVGGSIKTSSDTYQYPFGYIFGTDNYSGGTSTRQYYYGSSSTGSTTNSTYYIPSSLKSVTITGGNILYGAFYNCNGLTSISIPDSVTTIGSNALYGCDALQYNEYGNVCYLGNKNSPYILLVKAQSTDITSCVINTQTKIINENAFEGCTELTSINIPDSVTAIGSYAFKGCSSLSDIIVPNSVTLIGGSAFAGCSNLESIVLPFVGGSIKTSTDTYQYPFGYIFGTSNYVGTTATKQYYYGSKTSSTTYSTYYIPSTLKNVTITGGNILYGAFYNCNGLTSITIPENVTTIGSNALYGCDALQYNEYGNAYYFGSISNPYLLLVKAQSTDITSCTINAQTRTINANAFEGCTELTSIDIPDSVTAIGSYAFEGCSGLLSIIIGNGIVEIDYTMFYDCTGLSSIVVNTGNAKYYSSGNCIIENSNKTLVLGCKSSIIPTDVTIIGERAFFGCTELKSVIIPDSVVTIENYAFRGCSALESLVIGSNVKTINPYAFGNCKGLKSVIFKDPVGWVRRGTNEIMGGGKRESIDSSTLDDPAKAAELLKEENYSTSSGSMTVNYFWAWSKN